MLKVVAVKESHFFGICCSGLPNMAGRSGTKGFRQNIRQQGSANQPHHGSAWQRLDRSHAVRHQLHPPHRDGMDQEHAPARAQANKPGGHGQCALPQQTKNSQNARAARAQTIALAPILTRLQSNRASLRYPQTTEVLLRKICRRLNYRTF